MAHITINSMGETVEVDIDNIVYFHPHVGVTTIVLAKPMRFGSVEVKYLAAGHTCKELEEMVRAAGCRIISEATIILDELRERNMVASEN